VEEDVKGLVIQKESGDIWVLRISGVLRNLEHDTVQAAAAKEIVDTLGISSRTVESHKCEMMESLELHHNAGLIYFAIKHGIVAI